MIKGKFRFQGKNGRFYILVRLYRVWSKYPQEILEKLEFSIDNQTVYAIYQGLCRLTSKALFIQ